ncbi:hypothetical protein D9M71_619930 [compost metagenome]
MPFKWARSGMYSVARLSMRASIQPSTAGSVVPNWREAPMNSWPVGRGWILQAVDGPLALCALVT